MTSAEMVAFLRNSVNVQQANVIDTAYLAMTDADILSFLQIAILRDYPEHTPDTLPTSCIYPVILLAKKELYSKLAVIAAPDYMIAADNNNYLKREQRFEHYYKLIDQVNVEYEAYQRDGGTNNTLTSYDVLLSDRFYTEYNYNRAPAPEVKFSLGEVTPTTAELLWAVKLARFKHYSVYLSTEEPVFDEFRVGDKVSGTARPVIRIGDARQMKFRLEGLTPFMFYYVGLEVADRSGLTSYAQMSFSTPEV